MRLTQEQVFTWLPRLREKVEDDKNKEATGGEAGSNTSNTEAVSQEWTVDKRRKFTRERTSQLKNQPKNEPKNEPYRAEALLHGYDTGKSRVGSKRVLLLELTHFQTTTVP